MKARIQNGVDGENHVYLLSRSSLGDFLDFMESYSVDSPVPDRQVLSEHWRSASACMKKLRKSEARWADDAVIHPLPKELAAFVPRVEGDAYFKKAYTDVPYEFGMVELDRLVVSQKLVCTDHYPRLHAMLGTKPTPEQLFKFCLPYDHPTPEHRAGRVADETFAFVSDSSDLRFQEGVLLRPDQIVGHQTRGPVAGVVALFVGFGSNYLNVIASNGRLVLNNGHHRACALRDLGVTHAPCVIERAETSEELDVVAPRAVSRNADYYLHEPRPPVLKDYFDERLVYTTRLAMTTKQIRVSYSIESMDMP